MRRNLLPWFGHCIWNRLFATYVHFINIERKRATTIIPHSRYSIKLPALPPRAPYDGPRRKLVIAFDIGTTFSGASFAKLEPGAVPSIQGVTRFPAQQKVGGNSKIPSIIYYDSEGEVRAVGEEARDEAFLAQAEEEEYVKVEWFKLHLRPKTLSASHITDTDIPPLPKGKRPIDVLADFIRYLFVCTREYIIEMTFNGQSYWTSIEGDVEFVLAHPNGWEGPQQSLMRKAAVMAGLVEEKDAHTRVQFVTEGEASLHFCVSQGTLSGSEMDSKGTIIVDAGGGTIDLSAYRKTDKGGFEEIAPTQCRLQGSVFVSRRARRYLEERLKGTRFGTAEEVKEITEAFDKTTKLSFRGVDAPSFIRFGGMRDRDVSVDIKNGQMKLAGSVVATFFEPSLSAILEAVDLQIKDATIPISTIVLVGGFAASDWLFSNLQTRLAPRGLSVCRPDGHVNKAVADGALSFYLDHFVSVRVAKFSYGIECCVEFCNGDTEHQARYWKCLTRPSGREFIPGAFSEILAKGTRVSEQKEFIRSYFRESSSRQDPSLFNVELDIKYYRGSGVVPLWMDEQPHSFSTLCTISADLSQCQSGVSSRRSRGGMYYTRNFDVVLLFGLTELKAQIQWKEKGVDKRCPAVVVYEGDLDVVTNSESKRDDF